MLLTVRSLTEWLLELMFRHGLISRQAPWLTARLAAGPDRA